jgi:nickel transport protein
MSRFSICNSQFSIFNFQFSLLVLLATLLSAAPASAHKLHVFAVANGSTIEGEVYAAGNSPIRDASVSVLGPNGEPFGATKTDDDGKFRFNARQRVEHTFVVDAGEGHIARYKVSADELPANLASSAPKLKPLTAEPAKPVVEEKPVSKPSQDSPPAPDVQQKLDAVHSQVLQLRKQLDAYEQSVRLHDILGGVGVILGWMGLSFYFLGVRRREKHK